MYMYIFFMYVNEISIYLYAICATFIYIDIYIYNVSIISRWVYRIRFSHNVAQQLPTKWKKEKHNMLMD